MKIYINKDGEITNENGEDMKVCELCQVIFNPKQDSQTAWGSNDTVCHECLNDIPF